MDKYLVRSNIEWLSKRDGVTLSELGILLSGSRHKFDLDRKHSNLELMGIAYHFGITYEELITDDIALRESGKYSREVVKREARRRGYGIRDAFEEMGMSYSNLYANDGFPSLRVRKEITRWMTEHKPLDDSISNIYASRTE